MRTYTFLFVTIVFIFVAAPAVYGQIVGWNFNGMSGDEESVEATTIDPFLLPSLIERGDGVNPSSLANSFNSSGFTAEGYEEAVENDDYIEFTIQAMSGSTVSLSFIDARFRRSGTGPNKFLWKYSIDGFQTAGIAFGDTITYEESGGDGHDQDIIDLSGIADLQDADSETVITIRLYGWGASSAGGTFAIGRRSGNDLAIDGIIGMPPGPVITHTPLEDTESSEDQAVIATITGENLVIDVEDENRPVLWYSIDAGGSWTHTYFENQDGDNFEFTIPGQSIDTEVWYYIAAKDDDDVTTNPFGGSGENPPGSTPPESFHSYVILDPGPEELAIYLTSDPDDTSEENRVQFPFAGMGSVEGDIDFFGDDDWTYIDPQFVFYAVAEGEDEIIAAEFYLEWDHEKGSVEVGEGNFFDDFEYVFQAVDVDEGRIRVNVSSLEGNVAPSAGSYFAEITVTVTNPGFHELEVTDVDLRYYDEIEDVQIEVPSVTFPGQIKFYLGDFGREVDDDPDGERGDGLIDFNDLMLFSGAYWSERGEDDFYRTKYDIGPTDAGGSYFAMPQSDGIVDFEDLVIFSIGYFLSAAGQLPKQVVDPLQIVVHDAEERSGMVAVPLGFAGGVDDVRAVSLRLEAPSTALTFSDAFAAGELDQEMGFIASRETGGNVQVDAAIIRSTFSQEGVFAYLYFDKEEPYYPGDIRLLSAVARNSSNIDIPVQLMRYGDEPDIQTPATFNLSQNFPNPFNPATTIDYQLAEDVHVEIIIYNVLGEKVAELVREQQEAGYYSVEWNGMTIHNTPAPSGMYIYRIQAGEYVESKRMMMIK